MTYEALREHIEQSWTAVTTGQDYDENDVRIWVRESLEGIEAGQFRVAEKRDGEWQVNLWVKYAILLYFRLSVNVHSEAGALVFYDKIPVKRHFPENTRVVPGGTAIRYGSYVAPKVIVMPPSYVNIGAYVGEGSMVDSHVLVGSGAQIGKGVHLGAGVQIGGILEPPQARPVIVEDNAFVGLNCGIAEGVLIGEGAVIGAGVTITNHTPLVDVNTGETFLGHVPAYSLVIPGSRMKETPAGTFGYNCPLIIKRGDYSNRNLVKEMSLWLEGKA